MTTMAVRDVRLFVDVVGHGSPLLLDTGGDSRWGRENAPRLLAERGFSGRKVELARRWFAGQVPAWQFLPTLIRLGSAYDPHTSGLAAVRTAFAERHFRPRPRAQIFGFGRLMNGWTVMDRLGEIEVPTLVLAGRDDFIFPPEHQAQLAAGIRGSRLRIVDGAGHNPHDERTAEVMTAVAEFLLPQARQPVARETRSGRTVGPAGGRSGGAVLGR